MQDYYIVSRLSDGDGWYCHLKRFPYVPVFGSIGEKATAVRVCRMMNLDGKVRYT